MATGTRVRMGRTAVLDTGAMQIVVSEGRSEPFDLGVFTHCGIDPRRKRYVLIKSRQHFRAGFEPIARHIVLCDGDGVHQLRPAPLHLPESPPAALPVRGRVMRERAGMRMTPAPVPRRARRQPPAARRAARGARRRPAPAPCRPASSARSRTGWSARAVAKQESLGLRVVTDGEYRRDFWHLDFLRQLDGVGLAPIAGMKFARRGRAADADGHRAACAARRRS